MITSSGEGECILSQFRSVSYKKIWSLVCVCVCVCVLLDLFKHSN